LVLPEKHISAYNSDPEATRAVNRSRFVDGAVFLVLAWTRFYTWGVPPAVRDARRDEIASDLWEFLHDTDTASTVSPASHLILRLIRGVPDDFVWRAEHTLRTSPGLASRFLVVTLVIAMSATAAWLFDAMRARLLPVPPPIGARTAAPPPLPPLPPPTSIPDSSSTAGPP
jgi:hypothetical protein